MTDAMLQKYANEGLKQHLAKTAETQAKKLTGRSAYHAKFLTLQNNGKVEREERVWTEDKLIDNNLGEARQMAVRTIADKTYLLVETGNYPDEATEDWKPGWQIYLKVPDNTK